MAEIIPSISLGDHNVGIQVGHNMGSINVHLPPKALPPPSSTVPFSRDPDFVDRPEIDLLRIKTTGLTGRVALVGLGGVGKSQLAIEHCYRLRENSSETWVLWIHASTFDRFKQSLDDFARRAKIVDRDDPDQDIFVLVNSWLGDAANGRWLLVLDSADEATYLFEQPSSSAVASGKDYDSTVTAKPLIEYLPVCDHGSILMTTRYQAMALRLVDYADIIKLGPMTSDLALDLLQKKLGHCETQSASKLVKALDNMPLAITQAAAYIRQRMPACSVRQYLLKFEKSEKSKIRMLDAEPKDAEASMSRVETNWAEFRRDREARNSIFTTWQVSFDHIRQIRPSAADLLSLMSFFNHQGIPMSLLRAQSFTNNTPKLSDLKFDSGTDSDSNTDAASNSSADDAFEMDIITLRNYLFISDTPGRSAFEMHRLVQLATRIWLDYHSQYQRWVEKSVANLQAALPSPEYENWPIWRELYPHTKMTLMSNVASECKGSDTALELASIFSRATLYALEQGNPVDAESLAAQSTKIRRRALGKEHPETLESMANLASAYSDQGRLDEAEQLEVQVLEIQKTQLGEKHRHTLTLMNNLAWTYWRQNRTAEAEELDLRVLELRKETLGEMHEETITSMASLAGTYYDQGRLAEAEELELRAIELNVQLHGEEHPESLTYMVNLSNTYLKQGKLEEAERLNMRVVELQKKILGEEHPDTLNSIISLARTYEAQGRDDEAKQLRSYVSKVRDKILARNVIDEYLHSED